MRYKISRSVCTTVHLNRPETKEYGKWKSRHRNIRSNMRRTGAHRNMQHDTPKYTSFSLCICDFLCAFFAIFACLYSSILRDDKQIAITDNDHETPYFRNFGTHRGNILAKFKLNCHVK